VLGLPLSAAGQASDATAPKWGPHIDFEAKPGSKRSLGEADLFVPLWQDGRNLVFGNLRGRFDDGDGREGNLGLGLRRMVESGWNLGGYAYFDRRKSENGFYYSQATFGGEALGRNWDLRANAYLPQGERVRDLGSTPGSSTAAVSGASVVVTTTAPTIRQERALKGFDAEVGWRVPLFAADEPRQLRLYAGGYHFKDDVVKVSGPRVRAELTMAELPQLWSGAQLIAGAEVQDDDARGGQTFLSVRLRVPLGGKAERPRQPGFQERRMTAPVVRDVDIVTQSRTVVTAPPVVETATALADGRAFTVIDSSSTPNLAAAVTALPNDSTALLSGTFSTAAPVDLGGNKSLVAGSMTVRTPSGVTATLSSPAAISSTFSGNTIQAPGNNTISGLTINATTTNFARAIALNSTGGNYNILNNTIFVTQTNGANSIIGVSTDRNLNVVISGNSITLTGGMTATALGLGSVGPTAATITGNTLNISGATNNFAASMNALTTINAGSTGNVLVSGTCSGAPASGSIGFTNGTTCP